MDRNDEFETLVEIMDRLRSPDGCPWDLEQNYGSLRSYLLEECYEVVEAIDAGDFDSLREELGDLLFQIVFLSRIASEEGKFTVYDVIGEIARKMVRRHPHVFGSTEVNGSAEVLRRWEEIKRREKEVDTGIETTATRSVLSGIPAALPALLKAQRLGTKASRVGFDWEKPEDLMGKVDEELSELRQAVRAGDVSDVKEELGDLLFTLAMLARHSGIDPEEALELANRKFSVRFRLMEERLRQRGIEIESAGIEVLDRIWNEIKAATRD